MSGGPWELVVPAPADWINLNQRLHWATRAKLTRAWRSATHIRARQACLVMGLDRVSITITVTKPTNRAYDVHNLMPTAKAVVDGLIDYGLCADDSNQYVTGPDLRPSEHKAPAQLLITITETP
ncbi:hypothetical protein ASF21_12770 [Arthrobacter sp. Leaf234]|uniref:hypothetical protein n=1 Tax=Arthrobacter sp. Leaf234 TaxID=1736303 RepID=UPI0006F7B927|nr:hypothetical protein [Arthrobacter sp. Leaf234]KQN99674.1 hypothetical protein ASF21_12770 [Arthrobacter sp. Leaf234]